MRKKLKTLLCASALLASFYSGCIYAADNIIIDTSSDLSVEQGIDKILEFIKNKIEKE